jgi:D-arabinose 1-dehydrogenase-like Zn-dependent alcohol dehydrogenase
MKAAVLTEPKKISIKEVPDPIIGGYDVLCQILSSAICSGTDRHIFNNNAYFNVKFPVIMGHEAIGRVIECGEKVKYFKRGDLITRIVNKMPKDSKIYLQWGAFAEKGVATDWQSMRDDGFPEKDWKKHTIHRVLPDNFDPIESAMIITWRETYSFYKRMKLKKDDIVLIIGSGVNALSFLKYANNDNLKTIIIGGEKRSSYFLNFGANFFVPYPENIIKKLKELGIKRVNVILDSIGDSKYLNKIVHLLEGDGKIGVYGLNNYLNYKIDVSKIKKDFLYFDGNFYDEGSAHDDIMNFIKVGKLDVWDFISKDHIYPLERINEAMEANWSGKTFKSIIKMNNY